MRGKRVSAEMKKLDIVIVAARYDRDDRRLALVRGFERRGAIWSDLQVYDRRELVRRLRSGARVVSGRSRELPGDFDVVGRVGLTGDAGAETLIAEGALGGKGPLPVPQF